MTRWPCGKRTRVDIGTRLKTAAQTSWSRSRGTEHRAQITEHRDRKRGGSKLKAGKLGGARSTRSTLDTKRLWRRLRHHSRVKQRRERQLAAWLRARLSGRVPLLSLLCSCSLLLWVVPRARRLHGTTILLRNRSNRFLNQSWKTESRDASFEN